MFMGKKEIRSGAFSSLFSFIRKRILWVMILLVVLLLPSLSSSEEYKNIGFKKDVSKELKQKFPMCDEFLDVKWIGKNKGEDADIGKIMIERYEYYEKKGMLHLLVISKNLGIDFYKLKKQDYYSKGFEKFMKESTFYELSGRNFMFKLYVGEKGLEGSDKVYNLRNFELWGDAGIIVSGYSQIDSFAIFTKTVCVLYPDKQAVFIAEIKKPFLRGELTGELKQTYDVIFKFIDEKCNQRKLELTESKKKQLRCSDINNNGSAKNSYALDINLDGINDYMFSFNIMSPAGPENGGQFVCFSKNGKYEFKNIDSCIRSGPLYFKANEKAFYFGKCNLTNTLTTEQGGRY